MNMHLDAKLIEDFVNRRGRLSSEQTEHLQGCISCRSAAVSRTAHVDPRRLFDIAQLDIIFDEPEWPHLVVCDACSSRFTAFLQVRVEEERKAKMKGNN